eukprot:8568670-Lingulodinium_polyedra.AAC.1
MVLPRQWRLLHGWQAAAPKPAISLYDGVLFIFFGRAIASPPPARFEQSNAEAESWVVEGEAA